MSNRKSALQIVKTLRSKGFEALFAGGCVRDMLLKRRANDYDVVTNAVPEQIVRLFRKTLKIGAQFGVVMVLLEGKQVEVATFRTEAGYADGRHPDKVEFATAKEDARRRDFTINGMFFDPIKRQILDFVGGQADLPRKIIRTIGNPEERFGEDYLRMLRAIRFAVRLDFDIEKQTWRAVCDLAGRIVRISSERIAAELEGILTHPNRRKGAVLLQQSGLAAQLFPDFREDAVLFGAEVLNRLPDNVDWALALAGLFAGLEAHNALRLTQKLKVSNAVLKQLAFLFEKRGVLLNGQMPLAELKMLLASPYFQDLFDFQKAIQKARKESLAGLIQIKKRAMVLKGQDFSPRPLLDGHELIALGATPGPMVGSLSRQMYIAQLSETISTSAEARIWVKNWLENHLIQDE